MLPTSVVFIINTRHFPQELIDYALDFLSDDTTTLASCSLVAHSWSRSSQYHLFSAVKILLRDDIPWNIPSFIQLLENSPHIGSFVQDLLLIGGSRQLSPQATVCPEHILPPLLDKLPRLCRLSLIGSRLNAVWNTCTCEPVACAEQLSGTPLNHFNLQTLTLHWVHHGSQRYLLKLMELFSDVETLFMILDEIDSTILSTIEQSSSSEVNDITVTPPQLRIHSGEFYGTTSLVLYRALVLTPSSHTLNLIRTSVCDMDELEALVKLARSCPNIHEIDLSLTPRFAFLLRDMTDWTAATLSSCHSLETFAVRMVNYFYVSGVSRDTIEGIRRLNRDIIETLSKFLGPITRLVIGIYSGGSPIDAVGLLRDYYDWDHMQSVLHGFRSLQDVTFDIHGPDNGDVGELENIEEFEEYIMARTTRLQEQCTVEVREGSEHGWGYSFEDVSTLTQLGFPSYDMS